MSEKPKRSKNLLLCRHADALPASLAQKDIERALSPIGIFQCRQARNWLSELSVNVEYFVCSPASRTRQTAALINPDPERNTLAIEETLYEPTAIGILKLVERLPAHIITAAVISHNPGLSYFATQLLGHHTNFATCQMLLTELYAAAWSEVSFGAANIKKEFIAE